MTSIYCCYESVSSWVDHWSKLGLAKLGVPVVSCWLCGGMFHFHGFIAHMSGVGRLEAGVLR